MKLLFALLQYCVPQHLLSRCIGCLAETTFVPIKSSFIALFIKIFKVDMSEAQTEDTKQYPTFNEFFVRSLKPGARPICDQQEEIACPADGTINQLGDIDGGCLLQAKGREYTATALLGGDEFLGQSFAGGKFFTVYLAPKDYHRVHMPFDGQLETMVHIPGDLFSVNNATAEHVNQLFARNERVVSIFDTSAGPMAVVMVGAMIVASIETVWAGQITPHKKMIRTSHYPENREEVRLAKGDEMGRFKLGSTAIVLFGPDMVEWDEELQAGSKVNMGQRIGKLINV
jgi:phosphatidylserine decarboxylase